MSQPDLGESLETYLATVRELQALYPRDAFLSLYSRQLQVILAMMIDHGQPIPQQAQAFCNDCEGKVDQSLGLVQ